MTFRALLIGNWRYEPRAGGLPALRGPEYDIEELKAALTHRDLGLFNSEHIDVRTNLTTNELRGALYEATEKSQPGDVLLIYYSGHGERLGADERLGLVGVDVPLDQRKALAFDTFQLKGWLDDARARSSILVLDCCYSGQYRDAELVNEKLLNTFGQGTAVLASGGNQVVSDQGPDGPSPFTAALAKVLLDESLGGTDGILTIEDVYAALDRYEPRLQPRPKRNFNAQGRIGLAARPQPDVSELAVKGWPDRLTVLPVSVTFEADHVLARWDRNYDGHVTNNERDVTALDPTRLAAIRRLSQLADAVMRSKDYEDRQSQWRARRALETAGVNLFEAALPADLKQLLRQADNEEDLLVRLDLSFDPTWNELAEYPWEYLRVPGPRGIDPARAAPRRVVVARAGRVTEWPSRHGEDKADVAVISSFTGRYARVAERIGTELKAMPSVRTVTVPEGRPASWATLMDAIDQMPEYIVLCVPLLRESAGGRVTAKLGFSAAEPDWREAATVAEALRRARKLSAVIIVSLTAGVGFDAVRAAPTVAAELNAALGVPIVFVCHTPGLEEYIDSLDTNDPQTFVGLLLAALTTGHELDQSVWFARDRVLRWIPAELQPTLGVPGFFHRSVTGESPKSAAGERSLGRVNRSRPGMA